MGPYATQLASIVPGVMPRANSSSSVAPQDSEVERTRLFEAWTHLFVQISMEAPLVLFLDDAKWAGSLELLHHLARNIGNQRILALVAYRDDELEMNPSPWKTILAMNRERLFHPLPLEPLEQKEVAQLISQKVEKTITPHLVDIIYQRTRGNPFFVEEVLRLLHERKVVVDTDAGVDLKEPASLAMPESVKTVINERVERLGKDAMELLRMASVIGREFHLRVIEEFAGDQEEKLISVMDRCERYGLVRSNSGLGEEKYAFTHELLQEALYETIGPARRRRYHLRIGQVIEKLYASRLEDKYESLAYHFREGNDLEKTVIYSHRAGVKAASHFAYREAVLYFEQALRALEHMPEGRQKLEQAIAIRIDLGPALIAIGSYLAPEVEENYIQAAKLCERGRPPSYFRCCGLYHEYVTGAVNCRQPGSRQSNYFLLPGANKTPFAYWRPITRCGRFRWTWVSWPLVGPTQIRALRCTIASATGSSVLYTARTIQGCARKSMRRRPYGYLVTRIKLANNRECTDHGSGVGATVHLMAGPDCCHLDTSSPHGQTGCAGSG